MLRKSVLITFLAISLLGCDDDFKQGSCDEGFYQQNDGNGGFFCAPIGEEGTSNNSMSEVDNL